MQKLFKKKVLITGASGFLGTSLAEACAKEGALLFGIDMRPPSDATIWSVYTINGLEGSDVEDLFYNNTFDIIFHLAGGASVAGSVVNPVKDFNSLLPPTLKLLQLVSKFSPSAHLVLFSSAAVYGNPTKLPVSESAAIVPLSPYGIHKALVEGMVEHYSRLFNLRSSVLRIFSAFGEGLRKQIFWDVMSRYEQALYQNPSFIELSLFGTGNESRDLIYGKDVAKVAILIAANPIITKSFEVYNVANGQEIRIKKAVESLFNKASIKPKITFSGVTRAGDPERWEANISKLKGIGFEPSTSIEESLGNYYNWFMENK